jgi:hypothetical protein
VSRNGARLAESGPTAVTALAAAGVAVLTFHSASLGVLATVGPIAVLPFAMLGAPVLTALLIIAVPIQNFGIGNLGVTVTIPLVVAALYVVRGALTGRLRSAGTIIDRPAVAILLVALMSVPIAVFFSTNVPSDVRYGPLRPVLQFGITAVFTGVMFVVARSIPTREAFARTLRLITGVGVVLSVYAVYQQAAFRWGLPGLRWPLALRDPTGDPFQAGGQLLHRSAATFIEPLNFGHFLIGTLAVTLAPVVTGATDVKTRRRLLSAAVVQMVAIVLTFSTGTILGLTATTAVFVFARRSRSRTVKGGAAIAVAFVLTLGVFGSGVWTGLTTRAFNAARYEQLGGNAATPYLGFRRSDYLRAAFRIVERRPLTGAGIGNFGTAAQDVYDDTDLKGAINPAAGSYGVLSGFAGEFGLPGLFALAWFVIAFVKLTRGLGPIRPEMVGFLAGFAGMLLHELTAGYSRLDLWLYVFAGVAVAGARLQTTPSSNSESTVEALTPAGTVTA